MNSHVRDNHLTVGRKLFIGGLPYEATDKDIAGLFEESTLKSAYVVVDNVTGRSKGYGFVLFQLSEDAQRALDKTEKEPYMLYGKKLTMLPARPKNEEAKGDKPGKEAEPIPILPKDQFQQSVTMILSPTPGSADKLVIRRLLIPFLKHNSDKIEKDIARTKKSLVGLRDGTKKKTRRVARLEEYEKSLIHFGIPGMKNLVTTDFCWSGGAGEQETTHHTVLYIDAKMRKPEAQKRKSGKGKTIVPVERDDSADEEEFKKKANEGVDEVVNFFNNEINVYFHKVTKQFFVVQMSNSFSYPVFDGNDTKTVNIIGKGEVTKDHQRVYIGRYEEPKYDTHFQQKQDKVVKDEKEKEREKLERERTSVIFRNIPFKVTAHEIRETLTEAIENELKSDDKNKLLSPIILAVKVPGSLTPKRKSLLPSTKKVTNEGERNAGFAFASFPTTDMVRFVAKIIVKIKIGDRLAIADACNEEALKEKEREEGSKLNKGNTDNADGGEGGESESEHSNQFETNGNNYDEEREPLEGSEGNESEDNKDSSSKGPGDTTQRKGGKKEQQEERQQTNERTVFVQNIPVSPPHMKLVKYIAEKRKKSLETLQQNLKLDELPEGVSVSDMDAHYAVRLLQKKVSKLLSNFGEIEKVFMNVLGKDKGKRKGDSAASAYDSSGIPTGTAFVVFKKVEAAKKAVEASRILGNYRSIMVDPKKGTNKQGSGVVPINAKSGSVLRGAMLSEIAKRELHLRKEDVLNRIINQTDAKAMKEKQKIPNLLIYGSRVFILPALSRDEVAKRSKDRLEGKRESVKKAKRADFRDRRDKRRDEKSRDPEGEANERRRRNDKGKNKRQFGSKRSPR